jgi:hypothetical protein
LLSSFTICLPFSLFLRSFFVLRWKRRELQHRALRIVRIMLFACLNKRKLRNRRRFDVVLRLQRLYIWQFERRVWIRECHDRRRSRRKQNKRKHSMIAISLCSISNHVIPTMFNHTSAQKRVRKRNFNRNSFVRNRSINQFSTNSCCQSAAIACNKCRIALRLQRLSGQSLELSSIACSFRSNEYERSIVANFHCNAAAATRFSIHTMAECARAYDDVGVACASFDGGGSGAGNGLSMSGFNAMVK